MRCGFHASPISAQMGPGHRSRMAAAAHADSAKIVLAYGRERRRRSLVAARSYQDRHVVGNGGPRVTQFTRPVARLAIMHRVDCFSSNEVMKVAGYHNLTQRLAGRVSRPAPEQAGPEMRDNHAVRSKVCRYSHRQSDYVDYRVQPYHLVIDPERKHSAIPHSAAAKCRKNCLDNHFRESFRSFWGKGQAG